MALGGKPLAALIVAKHAPPAGGPPKAGGEDDAKDGLSIAQNLIAGVEAKDPRAVAAALQAYCEMHEAQEPGGGEPDGDEGPPPT